MRFLIDNALPSRLATLLQSIGHDAVHVRDYRMHASLDHEILAKALDENRVVVSADSDFSTILAWQTASSPSFILFRDPNLLSADDFFHLLGHALPILDPDLTSGCVAVFRRGRLRVRKLPFSLE